MAYKSLSCGDGTKSDVRTELDGFMTMDGLYKGRAGGLARKFREDVGVGALFRGFQQ